MAKPHSPPRALLLGILGLVGGLLLAWIGNTIGKGTSTGAQVAAGTTVVLGVILAFLSVFVFLLPPLLPSR